MLDPFGYSPLRPAPGRDLYQPNLGPHRCLEPGGRPGAGRVNGSNGPTKLVHYITKRIFLMLDPFGYSSLRPAPGRDLYQPNLGPHRCLEPGGRPGAGCLNGSKEPTKLVHIITKRIFLMLDPFGYSPLRPAPGRDLYQPNLGPHRCLEPGCRPGAGRLNGSNGPTKLVHIITKRIFLMLDPFGYSSLRPAPRRDLYQPNLGPHRCLEPGGRPGAGCLNGSKEPTKLVHIITKRIFLMLDPFRYSPLRPTPGRDLYQPNLGPHRCLEPGCRPGAGRLNGSNGPTKLVHIITKRIFLMLDPFGYSPLRPAPGRDLYQPNLGPHRCLEPGGRPGAGRLNGSNGPTKLVHIITKRIFLMLDPFGYSPLRPAPGRDLYQPNLGPHRCLEPGGCPGAGRVNGSNGPTKLVHIITKRIFLMLDPFGYSPLRPAPGWDLYQPNLGPHRCFEPGGRPGAGRVNGSNGPTKLVHYITKRIFLMLDPFGYSSLRPAPGRDLYQPNLGPLRCLEPGGRPGAGRLNGSKEPTKLVHIITKRIFLMLDPFGYSPLRIAPGRDLYQPNLGPHRCLEPGCRPGAGRLNGSNGPTKLVHIITKRIFLMLDPFGYSPLRPAPGRDLYQPNLGPHRCLEPGGCPGAGRVNGSNGPTKWVHIITKRIFLMLDPFGYSSLRPAPGRDLYQPNLGPHRCLEPGGRPGAGRLNGSNEPTKLVHIITKRIFLMLDPFGYSPLRPTPGRDLYQPNLGPHRCLEPGGRPGAGRVNGSNGPTKLVHIITKRIFLMLDPFGYSPLRPAPGRDLYQPILGPQWCLEPVGRPGAGRVNGSNGPTNLVHYITKRLFLMLDQFGYSSLRPAPGRDLYQPNLGPHRCLEPGGRPGAGRLNGSNEPTKWVHIITKTHIFDVGPVWIFAPTACPRTGPIPSQCRSP